MNDSADDSDPIVPADPLDGRAGTMVELLATLTDDEVIDHIRHWEAKRARYEVEGDGRGSFWCSRLVSGGKHEARQRGMSTERIEGPPPKREPMPWD